MTGKKQKKSKLELKSSPEALKKVLGKMYALKRQKEKELRIIDGIILHIKRQCHHKIIKDSRCDIAVCSICGSQFGWYCDKSPTHHCEYEVGENCIHCGQQRNGSQSPRSATSGACPVRDMGNRLTRRLRKTLCSS